MPVAPEIGRIGGNDHEMPSPGPDLLHAAGAQVGLVGLERVDQTDLDGSAQRGINAHSRITAITRKAAITIT
jgi:hypothetical protein